MSSVIRVSLVSLFLCSIAHAESVATPPLPGLADPVFGYVVTGGVAFSIAVAFGLIRNALADSHWSLAEALSEESDITLMTGDAPSRDATGKPIVVSKLCASTSRFIAMFGLIAILILYVGFGLIFLNSYAATGHFSDSSDVVTIIKFVAAGGTLFAPYLINKVSSMFDWLSPKKTT